MKYQSSNTRLIHDLDFSKPGRYTCPECSEGSKRRNPKDLESYQDSERAFCHKCQTTFFPYTPHRNGKEYKLPERKNNTRLSDKTLKYWEGRMIRQSTLIHFQVYSERAFMPQFGREVETMCFPYLRGGELVNVKYRGPNKTFKLESGAELIWYNFDVLTQADEVIICEGEGEVLTWHENGFSNAISVPNGAGGNVEYLDHTIELFDRLGTVYLATDNDTKGIELRDELARRIGPEKCRVVNFRECKDGNEYFCKYGGLEFKQLIDQATPVPIKGIVRVNSIKAEIIDLRENGIQPGKDIDFLEVDRYATWELSRLATVTGVPGNGKSEFVDFVVSRLNLFYGWPVAYFTPENYPLKFHYSKLHEKFSGCKFGKDSESVFWSVYEHIKDNFHYILNEENFTVETVLDAAKMLIRQYGVKVVVLDPYNRFEHRRDANESETQYISRFLDQITTFAKVYNVLVFLVAHPRKMEPGMIPNLYDIAGSANFYNKTDYGLTVHRERDETGTMSNEVSVIWHKIRFKHLGQQGTSNLRWNYTNGRFEERISVDQWDNTCWLNVDTSTPVPKEKKEEELWKVNETPPPF